MDAALTMPEITSVEQGRVVLTKYFSVIQDYSTQLQQAHWRIAQLEKELYGPTSERRVDANYSREQILMSLFPAPAEPPATQQVLLKLDEKKSESRPRRQPAAKVLETVTERIEPEEKNLSALRPGQVRDRLREERALRIRALQNDPARTAAAQAGLSLW